MKYFIVSYRNTLSYFRNNATLSINHAKDTFDHDREKRLQTLIGYCQVHV